MKSLMILGASGLMGKRIVRLSEKLLPGVRIIKASRGATDESGSRRVDIHDPVTLETGLIGIDAVINAIGPFDYDPALLLAACSRQHCHYIDIADTPEFTEAVENCTIVDGITIVSGCSTIPGLVDVLATDWNCRSDVSSIRVFLSMGSANPVSPVLLFCLLRPLGRTAPGGSAYFALLRRKTHAGLPPRLYGPYPALFDREGLRVGDRRVPASFHVGMDRTLYGHILRLAATVLPRVSDKRLLSLCRILQPALHLVRMCGTTVGVLTCQALDAGQGVIVEIEVRAADEGLDVPSLPAVWTARLLLNEEKAPAECGVLRMDSLFTPAEVARWLRDAGYSVTGLQADGDHEVLAGTFHENGIA